MTKTFAALIIALLVPLSFASPAEAGAAKQSGEVVGVDFNEQTDKFSVRADLTNMAKGRRAFYLHVSYGDGGTFARRVFVKSGKTRNVGVRAPMNVPVTLEVRNRLGETLDSGHYRVRFCCSSVAEPIHD